MSNPNYITPAGARRLSEELGRLRSKDRPRTVQEVADAAAQGDRSENAEYIYGKRKLREIDRRMRYLTKRLESAMLVDPGQQRGNKVFFGATIDIEEESGARHTYQIVGEDETDSKSGKISWRSPVGRALLGKTAGDVVVVNRPVGDVELEILAVRYIPQVLPPRQPEPEVPVTADLDLSDDDDDDDDSEDDAS
ncbi:transcription elongation factor GreB [Chondromyces crocatus]|uniref:Transcription elongation factor GreB n=1 Tax=Chondromyces crocatus TaxID=52 RepID=A0A0K1EHK9_CHOCO|nr:transcription elongation factor GreB [Chondromyces crocatus]AKT40058.1 transcription elongation factor GreB [Chondromyces crocatus]